MWTKHLIFYMVTIVFLLGFTRAQADDDIRLALITDKVEEEVGRQTNVNITEQSIRIAVINVGSKAIPSSFAELFWVHLSEIPNVELVERELITKILKEQELNLLFGNSSESANAVEAGKLMRADVLFMLESGEPVDGQIPVRLRLVETQYGLKFWDGAVLLDQVEKNHPAQAKYIANSVIVKLSAKSSSQELLFVGIGTFRSEELTRRWNWISDELAAVVEQRMVLIPSVALLERNRTQPLIQERSLVDDLPEELRASAIFIDGSFRFDHEKNNRAIIFTLYGYCDNKKIFTVTVEGELEDLTLMSERAVAAVAEKINIKPVNSIMDRSKEANLLMNQAKTFTVFEDYYRALALYQAAAAVDMNSIEARLQLLTMAHFLTEHWGANIKGEKYELYKKQIVPLLLNNVGVSRYIVDYCTEVKNGRKPKTQSEKYYANALRKVCVVFYYPAWISYNLGNQNDSIEIMRTFQVELAELYPVLLDTVEKYNDDFTYAHTIKICIRSGSWWASTPQQYLNNVYDWLELSVSKRPNYWYPNLLIYSYNFDRCPLWANRKDNAECYLAFLDKLSRHTSPLIRACAHQAFVEYYTGLDNETAVKHYNDFIETIVNEIIPALPEWGHKMGFWSSNLHYKAVGVVGEKDIAESKARIIFQALRYSKKFGLGRWRDEILSCCKALERVGETQQAVSLLISCRDKLLKEYPGDKDDIETINSWLRTLKEKHPDIAIDVELIPTKECNPSKLLDIEDISHILKKHGLPESSDCFRRLLIDEKTAAIVCVWGSPKQTQCGIVWLNPETFTFRTFQMYESPFELSLGRGILRSFYYRSGPVSAICENTVYVSFPNFGIIIFPNKGKPQLLCEENGLPSNMIRSMDAMSGHLYAVTGLLFFNGLIEVETNTATAKILISPKSRENPHPLDGSSIVSVIADRWANRLWLLVDRYNGGNFDFYYYDPRTALVTPVPKETINNKNINNALFFNYQRQGHFLNINTSDALYTVDLSTEEIALVAQHGISKSLRPKRAFWKTDLRLGKFAGNREALIGTARDEGGQYYSVIFNADEQSPKKLIGASFPHVNNISDFGRTERGLLILTRQCLSIIPSSSHD